jgi:hypothetical protein
VKAFTAHKDSAVPVIDMAQTNAFYAVMLTGDVSSQGSATQEIARNVQAVRRETMAVRLIPH